METPILEHVLVQLRNALERDDLVGAANIIEALRPADQADLFNELDEDQQRALLAKIAPEDSADILEELDDANSARRWISAAEAFDETALRARALKVTALERTTPPVPDPIRRLSITLLIL
jgi:Mg/Co/Ni transporter MgtE